MITLILFLVSLFVSSNGAGLKKCNSTCGDSELEDGVPNMDIPHLTVYTGQSDTESFMIRASLKDTFSSKGPYTVFGPSNLAWFELSSYWRKLLFLNNTALREVVLYHSVGNKLYTTQFHNEQLIPSLLPGYNIRLNIYKHNTVFTVSGAVIIKSNQNATNGVVHMLNSVMRIPVSSIYTTIQTTTGLTLLRQAVRITDLVSILNGTSPLTMFVPSDSAFMKLSAGELNKLLSNPKRLADILEYHILRGTMYAAAFYSEDKVPTYNGQSLLITNTGSQIEVNGIELALQDFSTTNGVIHVIDTLLFPPNGL